MGNIWLLIFGLSNIGEGLGHICVLAAVTFWFVSDKYCGRPTVFRTTEG